MDCLLGFLGYGEAAFHISAGLKTEGLDSLVAFDMKLDDANAAPAVRERAAQNGVALAGSTRDLCGSARFVASLTSAAVALKVAESAIPYLKSGQVYVDMNAASPAVKAKIAAISRAPGVLFCDAAVMNPVPGAGHKVPISLSGDGAKGFFEVFSKYGMNLTDLDAPAGASSAIKMFRSVFMKGLPQLLIEAMIPACKFGALDAITRSLDQTLNGKTIEQLANAFIPRTILHAERRAHEMNEVVGTLSEMGCDASMAIATERKLEALVKAGVSAKIANGGKVDYRDALKILVDAF